MTVYIAGAISSDPDYKRKFWRAEAHLIDMGMIPLSPTWMPDGLEYEQYMRLGFAMLRECDAIYLLRDWKNSMGAQREFEEAVRLGKEIIYQGD